MYRGRSAHALACLSAMGGARPHNSRESRQRDSFDDGDCPGLSEACRKGTAIMNEMLKTIEPKSDQLNAYDLFGGRVITIKITEGHVLPGEQPVALRYDGDNGKPYKPCKSMRRVIVKIWGPNSASYIGGRMTLYRDDTVKFGADAVGGLRISHMSGIKDEVTMALTATRASRKPFTVKALTEEPRAPWLAALEAQGNEIAEKGTELYKAFWANLTTHEKQTIGAAQHESWKRIAADAKMSA